MRIVCLSDTHLRHLRGPIDVPDGDLLIHAGDGLSHGTLAELWAFAKWLDELPHRHKVFVAGNHDVVFEKNPDLARAALPPGVIYLQDASIEIEGIKIYGSPWQPEFNEWAFNLPRGHRLREKWNRIPRDVDVLITHGPPMGVLDPTFRAERVGCKDLRQVVERVRPKLHVFGHVHLGHGTTKIGNILFVNAAVCTESYTPSNPPIVIELDAKGARVVEGPAPSERGVRPLRESTPPLW